MNIIPANSNNPSWLFVLPLYHFLSGLCNPFDEMKEDLSHAAHKPSWWGTADVANAVERLKNSTEWSV